MLRAYGVRGRNVGTPGEEKWQPGSSLREEL